jgi:hypothetical protein
MRDRAALWNAVEAVEKRKDAQLAREIQLSLPHEMSDAQRRDLVRAFVAEQFVSAGMVADIAIHAPGRAGDERNHHAHVMLSLRELTAEGFGKKARDWNDSQNLERWRAEWAAIQNREFERLGIQAHVDHRSFEARGIDREPETHKGPGATALERRGEQSRIKAENDSRRAANENRADRHAEVLKIRSQIAREREQFSTWAHEKAGELQAAQDLTRLDLVRKHELERDQQTDELRSYYGPHMATVQADLAATRNRLKTRGVRAVWRYLTGRMNADRDRVEKLQATIRDTEQRMSEARAKLEQQQAAERRRVEDLQERRRQEQAEGIERARQRKEQVLAAQLAKAAQLEVQTKSNDNTQQTPEQRRAARLRKAAAETSENDQGKDKGLEME